MDAIDAIQRRTSVRRFRPDPVPRETIALLLDCAVRAPNHKLTEPWRFAVLTGAARGRLAELRARHRLKRYADPGSEEARAGAEKVRRETEETPAFVVVMCAVNPDEITREEDYAAAMMAIPTELGSVPPHWKIYFAVSDCEGQTTLAQSLGGTVRFPPTDAAGVGRYSVLADPQGAVFAVIQPTAWQQAAG